MKTQGQGFNYKVNGENKTKEEIDNMDLSNMNCTVDGLSVLYSFPDQNYIRHFVEIKEKIKLQELRDYLITDNIICTDLSTIYGIMSAETEDELKDILKKLPETNTRLEKEIIRTKTEEILDEVEKYQQEVNGGILKGEEFPYDFTNLNFNVITSSNIEENETIEYFQGIKETEGKLDYSEINFRLLDLMAKRFMDNKVKYPKGNSKKVLDKNEILWAAFRHIRKMIQPIENDPETYEDHLSAVLTNMSIILDQLDLDKSK